MIETIGIIAGFVTMSAQIPQIIKAMKTQSTHDISLGLYLTLFTGVVLWILYGGLTNNYTVFYMNLVLLISVFMMIILKLKYGLGKR